MGRTILKLTFLALATLAQVPPATAATLLHSYSFTVDVSDGTGSADGNLLNGASVGGGSLQLDGIDDLVQFDTHLVPTSGSYSVSLFFKQNVAQSGFVEYISQGATGGPGFYLGQDTTRKFRASDSWVNTGVALPAAGDWHHLALSVGAGASRLYLDGSLVNTLGFAITTTNGGTHTRLGTQFQSFAEFFNGSLDEVMIFDGALGDTEVAALAAVTPASVVPLPTGAWLLGPALLVLMGRRRATT